MWRDVLQLLLLLLPSLISSPLQHEVNVHLTHHDNSPAAPLCTNDRVRLNISVAWTFLEKRCRQQMVVKPFVGVYHMGSSTTTTATTITTRRRLPPPLARFPLCTERVRHILDMSEQLLQPKQPRQVIWCSLDADLCTKPTATEAIGKGLFGGPNEDPLQSSLSITFDQSTNMPNVEGNNGVDSILSFSANIGSNYTGVWLTPRTLQVVLTNSTGGDSREKLGLGALQVYFVSRVPEDEYTRREEEKKKEIIQNEIMRVEKGERWRDRERERVE